MDGVAAGFGTIACCCGAAARQRGVHAKEWRRWCWRESQLIGASGGGGRLRWRREEPERTSSGGAGGAAAAGTSAARGPVPCGPAQLSTRPEPSRRSHIGPPCGHASRAMACFVVGCDERTSRSRSLACITSRTQHARAGRSRARSRPERQRLLPTRTAARA